MALYLGKEKVKICLGGVICRLSIPSNNKNENGITLMSSDNYVLKDSDGVLLLAKELD